MGSADLVSASYLSIDFTQSLGRISSWRAGIASQSYTHNENRGACALTRAGASLYPIKLNSACREPYLSLASLDPVPLSKIGTGLLAAPGSKGKERSSLTGLRNAASYCTTLYCIVSEQETMEYKVVKAPSRNNGVQGRQGAF